MSHTPGPWKIEHEQIWARVDIGKEDMSNGELQPIYEVPIKPQLSINDDGTVTMTICYESWRQFPSINFKEMQQANAHLIASAPELLEALKAAAIDIELNAAGEDADELLNTIFMAIAKAEEQ